MARSARKFWRGLTRRGFAVMFTLALTVLFFGAAAKPGFDLWWAALRERRLATSLARRGNPTAILALRYRELTDLLARAGWRRSPAETPAAFLTRPHAEMAPDLAPVMATTEFVTDAFTRARYAEEPVADETLSEAAQRVRALRRLLRVVKR